MKKFVFIFAFSLVCFSFYAQADELSAESEEELSFDFNDTPSNKDDFSVNVGGAIFTGISLFFDDFKNFQDVTPSSLVWGNLKLEATTPLTYAIFSANLNDQTLPFNLGQKLLLSKEPIIPRWIDETFLQVNAGAFYFSGGLKKVNWGRSDLFSVLDVINPRDETNSFDIEGNSKLPIPMFQFVAYMPHDVKLEGVFLPMLIPNLFALEGRWKPHSISEIEEFTNTNVAKRLQDIFDVDTAKLSYAHGGLRLTTTIALTHDLGFQYFYGYSKKPYIIGQNNFITSYPSFHNIGFDYGTAIGPVNLKMEMCANIATKERNVNSNSNIAWNAGFDVALKYALTLNMVLRETIYFYSDKPKEASFALIRKYNKTDTLAFISLSQSIFRGAVEWKIAFITGFENVDFAIEPSIHCLLGTVILDAKVGVFLGRNEEGNYSQYKKNNFVKLSLGYEF